MIYMVVYVPFFLIVFFLGVAHQKWGSVSDDTMWILFMILIPCHFLGMAQNFLALFLTLRDLYRRRFPRENQKLIWCLLILATGGIGWVVYVFRYALEPRPTAVECYSPAAK